MTRGDDMLKSLLAEAREGELAGGALSQEPVAFGSGAVSAVVHLAFVESPQGEVRIHRTGDLARINPATGCLELLGRLDSQVQVHGKRVDLLEVETVLGMHPPLDLGVSKGSRRGTE
eukprot:gene27912-34490_t